jgi:PAS domain S-box-containing protein
VSEHPVDDHRLREQIQSCLVQRQNLEAIFDSVADAVIAADLDLRIMQLNRAATALTGLSRDEATATSVIEALHLRDDDGLTRSLRERRETDSLSVQPGADEDRRHLLATTRLLTDEAGTARGVVLILRDVTELQDMRRQLAGDGSFHGLVGRHPQMREIYDLVEQLGDSDATVLVLGESGTGK